MSDENRSTEPNTAAAYEVLDAMYEVQDEYIRNSRRLAEQIWMPWVGPFMGAVSPFVPPEQWARAYGDVAKVWMSMAQAWTSGWQSNSGRPEGSEGTG